MNESTKASPDLRLRMCLKCYWLTRNTGAYYCDRNESPDWCTHFRAKHGHKEAHQ